MNTKVLLAVLKYGRRVLAPSVRAFVVAYLYVTIPRCLVIYRRAKSEKLRKIRSALRKALHPHKFPALAGKIVLRINLVEPVVALALGRLGFRRIPRLMLSTFVASVTAALTTFPQFQDHVGAFGRHHSLDLTLLVATRAVDTVFSSVMLRIVSRGGSAGDAALFVASCSLIMFAWFFSPERLPPAYLRWITAAANMDTLILTVLKSIREKKLEYGVDGPCLHLLADFCRQHGQDPRRGLLTHNIPLECEVVHAFRSKLCEVHALWRFARGFRFAFTLYGLLNLAMLAVPRKVAWLRKLWVALRLTVRSLAFLGAYIALFWYAVCLARTRVLPRLFPSVPVTRWDDTVCVAAGCVACGLSCLVETPQRRKELALFVAPRAAGTLVDAAPTARNLRVECAVFAVSIAVLVAFSKRNAASVRGIFGKGLQAAFALHLY